MTFIQVIRPESRHSIGVFDERITRLWVSARDVRVPIISSSFISRTTSDRQANASGRNRAYLHCYNDVHSQNRREGRTFISRLVTSINWTPDVHGIKL